MSNYQIMINRITNMIYDDFLLGKNYILVGDNSSGKSEILRSIVEKKIDQAIYFIDSVNRTFDASKVEFLSKTYQSIKLDARNVVSERLSPFNFNLQDTFYAATCIEQLFDKYHLKISDMCKKLLNRDIQIVRVNLEAGLTENKVVIDGNETKLSSGYQAVIRIFCEILFFEDVMCAKGWDRGFIVIDELDEYLSPKYSTKIYNFLQTQFTKMNFFVTTHSLDMVKATNNINLVILHDTAYEIYTSGDLRNCISAEDIFAKLFFEENMVHTSNNDRVDEKLRILLNLKVAGLWDEKSQKELQEIANEDILPHQKMIYKQIKEW